MRNNINLQTLVGVLMLCSSILICSIIAVDVLHKSRFNNNLQLDSYTMIWAIIGIGYLISGIALFLKKGWSSFASTIVLGLSGITWIGWSGKLLTGNEQGEDYIFLGMTVVVITVLACGILLLGNERFANEGEGQTYVKEHPNILDA